MSFQRTLRLKKMHRQVDRDIEHRSAVVWVLAAAVLALFASAWLGMLALGAAHSFDGRVPAFGYWTCFFLTLALRMIGPGGTRLNRSRGVAS